MLPVLLLVGLMAVGFYHEDSVTTQQEFVAVPLNNYPQSGLLAPHSITANTTVWSVLDERLLERQLRESVQQRPSEHSLTVSEASGRERMRAEETATEQMLKQAHRDSEAQDSSISTTSTPAVSHLPSSSLSNWTAGYVLAVDYWEQQTSGSRNLQSLQCWAAQYNLSVVEPVMARSVLRTPLSDHPLSKGFWFRDMFDLGMWNRLSSQRSHSQLVSWERFLGSAPRDIILVSFKHAYPDEIRQRLKKLGSSKGPHVPPSQRVKEGCSTNWNSAREFFNRHHFHVAREVCFNFDHGDKLSSEQFKSHLYGQLWPHSTTVVFRQWRGTGPPARVLIHDAHCGNTGIQEEVGPSRQLMLAATEYQQRFLGGGPYLAVMARMEKVKSHLKKSKGHLTMTQCFTKLLASWREVKEQSGLNRTFLAIDMGRYGSNSIHDTGEGSQLSAEFNKFFRALYGTGLSPSSWEESFEHVAHTTDSGYVALLQKVLVVQAKCVVFIGGGSFQKHAQSLYLQTHRTEQCVRIVRECTPAKNL